MLLENIKSLKLEYNALLMREINAEIFFNDPQISLEEKLYCVPEYKRIIDNLSETLSKLDKLNEQYTFIEVSGGFRID